MGDNRATKRPQDYSKVNVHDQGELIYWTKALRVSSEKLKAIVDMVGPTVSDVKQALRK